MIYKYVQWFATQNEAFAFAIKHVIDGNPPLIKSYVDKPGYYVYYGIGG